MILSTIKGIHVRERVVGQGHGDSDPEAMKERSIATG